MASLCCPLCSVPLSASTLESHLRQELAYPSVSCALCRFLFTSAATARQHFRGPLAEHRGGEGAADQAGRGPGQRDEAGGAGPPSQGRGGGRGAAPLRLWTVQLLCRGGLSSRSSDENEAQYGTGVGNQVWQSVEYEEEAKSEEAPEDIQEAEQPLPAEELSEPEKQHMDSKPDIKHQAQDLKPQLSADGKVACTQCGLRIAKQRFKDHALGTHSFVQPFSCNLCPHNEKSKGLMGLHLRKEHKQQLSSETFTFLGSEATIAELVEQCFGAAKNADWARLRCLPCDKLINAAHLKNHAASYHLGKPLHACRLCPFTSKRFTAADVNKHVKNAHKRQPGPDTIDSSQAQHYAPIIKNMIPQLFSKEGLTVLDSP